MVLPPTLARPFRMIAFDWDGTAVSSRTESTARLRSCIERLLRSGVVIAIITGTNLRHIDSQLGTAMRGRHKQNLFIATNRGSEVYGFDARSRAVALHARVATLEEDEALTEVAEALRQELVQRTGLDVRVIHDRLNRRKIDLLPLADLSDAPPSSFGRLLDAVETRLRGAGLHGGLRDVLELAVHVARDKGLPAARITSDVRHVEIGLTDKADAIRWLVREVARPRDIARRDVLIAGDEFGPIAGAPGSDQLMMVAPAAEATFVSVGTEPNGVPEGVLHLGGGPARLREILAAQASMHPIDLPLGPTVDPLWVLADEGFTLEREHEIESLFAVGNGYVGSRDSRSEGGPLSAPATLLAGVFQTPPYAGAVPELAPTVDVFHLQVICEGQPIRLDAGQTLEHRRVLDLGQGVVWRTLRHRDASDRTTTIRSLRLASLHDRHLVMQSVSITPEDWSGSLVIESSAHGELIVHAADGVTVAVAIAGQLEVPGRLRREPGDDGADGVWEVAVSQAQTVRLDRIFVLYTSRDLERPDDAARLHLERVLDEGFEAAAEAHRDAWLDLWRRSDVSIDGDAEAQRAVRFAIYHLASAVNPEDERVSIGARGLTGLAYKGHVFWDTEVFMLPFFVLNDPKAARTLLAFRHRTLDAARAKASRLGYRGALYAWESAGDGNEVTPSRVVGPDGQIDRVFAGDEEHHISADVAFGVWSYWQATHDEDFLESAGAEILLETARFWASRVELGPDDLWHALGVVGPDEYHESVDDDAYTNGMAQWNLERGAELVEMLARERPAFFRQLAQRVDLNPDEPAEWQRMASSMYTGLDPRTGLIEQFRGYFDLEHIDLGDYGRSGAPLDVLLGRDRVRASQVIKQPDVLMLIHLLWDRFAPSVRAANFDFYEPRTAHGSSLSPPVHAILAARLGEAALAEHYFRQTMEIDLADNVGSAAGGVHLAALGGLWQTIVHGFAGLSVASPGPQVEPRLPASFRRVKFSVLWRGRPVAVEIGPEARAAALQSGAQTSA